MRLNTTPILLAALTSAQSTSTATVTASTTTTSLLLFSVAQQPFVASVIAADSTAATYSITCGSATGSTTATCPLGPSGATITSAAASYDFFLSAASSVTESIHCALTGTTTGTCTSSEAGPSAGTLAGTMNRTVAASDLSYYPVTVTGGLDKLASAASASSVAFAAASTVTTTTGTSSQGASVGSVTKSVVASGTESVVASSTSGAAVIGKSVGFEAGIAGAVVGLLGLVVA